MLLQKLHLLKKVKVKITFPFMSISLNHFMFIFFWKFSCYIYDLIITFESIITSNKA